MIAAACRTCRPFYFLIWATLVLVPSGAAFAQFDFRGELVGSLVWTDAESDAVPGEEGSEQAQGLEVLLDDRDARPGVKFADAELIGIPHRVVVSDRGLEAGELEYRHRRDEESRNLKREEALKLLKESTIS